MTASKFVTIAALLQNSTVEKSLVKVQGLLLMPNVKYIKKHIMTPKFYARSGKEVPLTLCHSKFLVSSVPPPAPFAQRFSEDLQ